MTWTYGVGAPSGLFVPSLTLGAAMGRLYGQGVNTLLRYRGTCHSPPTDFIASTAYAAFMKAASVVQLHCNCTVLL